jgi:glyoxylase-like metal-dependent hydrolase (beta-lactamase superfamily II)
VEAQEADDGAARRVIARALEAMGGADAVLGAERMRLFGYAQLADGFGSGNVAASPHAPQKYGAHNDFQLAWDLVNGRYMQRDRDYLLFPFAASRAHDYSLNRAVLDGEIAFQLDEQGNATRGGDAWEMRMWSRSYNPVAALQSALAQGSRLANVRVGEEKHILVDVATARGNEFTLGFDWETGLPASISWSGPNHLLGEVRYTTHWTGYVPFDGIKLPLGLVTNWDWRDLDLYKIYGEGWIVNGRIPDLAAPPSVREPAQAQEPLRLEVLEAADGVWYISSGTTIVEFADHLLAFELGGFGYDDETLPVIELARSLRPNKPLRFYVASHQHDDHSSGLRTAVAEGLAVIAHAGNEEMFREIVSRPAPNFPDALHRDPEPLRFTAVDDHLSLRDEARTLDIYHVIGHNHMANALFAYDPQNKIMIAADILPAPEWQWWADAYLDNLEHYGLEVDTFVSTHFGVMDHSRVLAFLASGREAVQDQCLQQAELGVYRTGCPPFFTRGQWKEGMEETFDLPFEGFEATER